MLRSSLRRKGEGGAGREDVDRKPFDRETGELSLLPSLARNSTRTDFSSALLRRSTSPKMDTRIPRPTSTTTFSHFLLKLELELDIEHSTRRTNARTSIPSSPSASLVRSSPSLVNISMTFLLPLSLLNTFPPAKTFSSSPPHHRSSQRIIQRFSSDPCVS